MRLFKPLWVSHGRLSKTDKSDLPIYSIDIHPDGSRLATGGMSDNCGLIVLWDMNKIRNPDKKIKKDDAFKLSQIDGHQSCVNCVRWSPQGKWLASAGMDHVVMLWEKSLGSRTTSTFGLKQKVPFKEHWRCVIVLRGHKGDIIDLAWNLNGSYLASASVDNHIIIWRKNIPTSDGTVLPLFSSVTSLDKHVGFVKGLTWDPVGRFLASQSDDKTLKVWRIADWTEEVSISDPFKNGGDHGQFMRLSWSPDGSCLAATHSINNFFPTIKLIERKSFQPCLDLVGHKKQITCVKYNPCIMSKQQNGYKTDAVYLAAGSKDRSISIWSNLLRRSFAVIHDLFTKAICDISWSSDGRELIASSLDGTIAYLAFSCNEVGVPWSLKEVEALHQKKYGCSMLSSTFFASKDDDVFASVNGMNKSILLESVNAILLKEQQSDFLNQPLLETGSTIPPRKRETVIGPSTQVESRAQDGRKRITPKFLGTLEESLEPVENTIEASQKGPSNERVEALLTKDKSNSSPEKCVQNSVENKSPHSQIITDTEVSVNKKRKTRLVLLDDDESGPSEAKRMMTSLNSEVSSTKRSLPSSTQQLPTSITEEKVIVFLPSKDHAEFAASLDQISLSGGNAHFVCGGTRSSDGMEEFGHIVVSITSNTKTQEFNITGVQCHKRDWIIRSQHPYTAYAHNGATWFCVGDTQGKIYFYRSNGQLVGSPLLCDSSGLLAMSHFTDPSTNPIIYLAALTRCGKLKIWSLPYDLQVNRSYIFCQSQYTSLPKLLYDTDFLPVLLGPNKECNKFRGLMFSENGTVIIQLQSGSVYGFCRYSGIWLEIFDSTDSFTYSLALAFGKVAPSGSLANIELFKSPKIVLEQPLPSIQKFTTNQRMKLCKFLDLQTKLSIRFGTAVEFKFWLTRWARALIECGEERQIRLLMMDLIGPVNASMDSWTAEIKGLQKRALFKEILTFFAINFSLQRTYSELKDLYDVTMATD